MSKPAKVTIRIRVQIGEELLEVGSSSPLFMSGDRRRWKRQIREHIDARVETMSDHFKVEGAP